MQGVLLGSLASVHHLNQKMPDIMADPATSSGTMVSQPASSSQGTTPHNGCLELWSCNLREISQKMKSILPTGKKDPEAPADTSMLDSDHTPHKFAAAVSSNEHPHQQKGGPCVIVSTRFTL